jgi:hypothetical protein
MTASFVLTIISKKQRRVSFKYFILLGFKISFLSTSTFLCTCFRYTTVNNAEDLHFFSLVIVVTRLLLRTELCPEVITISAVHYTFKKSTRKLLKTNDSKQGPFRELLKSYCVY